MLGDAFLEELFGGGHLLSLNCNVGGVTTNAAKGLVHHDARMGECVALPGGTGAEEELAHRGAETHADCSDLGAHELHGVVDGHASGHRSTRGVDVEPNWLVGILGLEKQHLGDQEVGNVVVDIGAEKDDAVLEETVEDVEACEVWAVGLRDRVQGCVHEGAG